MQQPSKSLKNPHEERLLTRCPLCRSRGPSSLLVGISTAMRQCALFAALHTSTIPVLLCSLPPKWLCRCIPEVPSTVNADPKSAPPTHADCAAGGFGKEPRSARARQMGNEVADAHAHLHHPAGNERADASRQRSSNCAHKAAACHDHGCASRRHACTRRRANPNAQSHAGHA